VTARSTGQGIQTAASDKVEWDTCSEDECLGVRLPSGGKCWAHADDQNLDAALKRLGEDGRLDARGVPITQALLGRLLAATHQDDHGYPILVNTRFDRATFHGDAAFRGATFQGDAAFKEATFQGKAWFDRATFRGAADFSGATFLDTAWFGYVGATFQAIAVFRGATFEGDAAFDMVTFRGNAWFDKATFRGRALFHVVSFQWMAVFRGATFHRYVGFRAATFQSDTVFEGATFQGSVLFDKATFQQTRQFGPMLVRKSLLLREAVLYQRAHVEVAAAVLCCEQARFPAGVQLRVRWAQVVLDDADLAAPSILSGVPPFADLDEDRFARAWRRLRWPVHVWRGRPSLLSVRRADLAGLTVSNIDLRACRFGGAHNLDKMRIEAEDAFGFPPPSWRWTKRQVIAEEHHWRSDNGERGWYRPPHRPPAWLEVERLGPAQVASLYRALRKGREDNKDEPGAADLYYGEMEMRRHARRSGARQAWQRRERGRWATLEAEHAVLWLYWLTSGYALRASRAVLGWVLLVLVGAAAFAGFGFKAPVSPQIVPVGVTSLGQAVYEKRDVPRPSTLEQFPDALAFSAESTVSLLRAPDRSLTLPGRWTQMVLRLLGPVLFGLFVLSLRGRVKR
jgi:uncharacterized protein YjbI with pentapeptide repeats